jgi:hypothetical protein
VIPDLWREGNTCHWLTSKVPVCDICGLKTERSFHIAISEEGEYTTACCNMKRDCFDTAIDIILSAHPEADEFFVRGVDFKMIGGKPRKRETIGLSKRYDVMRRDGFQCVLCGASGKNARLEIDHIVPVSKGGSDFKNNLRTLCFKCNRGKRDKIEE